MEFCKNNFIFKFFEYLDQPIIEMLFLDLLGVTNHSIIGSFQFKFWKYLQTINFFCDLSKIMLNNEMQSTSEKFDNNFMMTEIKIDLRNEKLSEEFEKLNQI